MEIAWAAGLFEGEGSISTPLVDRQRLQLKMNAEASVRRFADALGVGTVYGPYGPYAGQMGRTPYFVWVAEGDAAVAAAALLREFVSQPWRDRLDAFRVT